MGVFEIIGGVVLLVVCALIVAAVAVQESKSGLGAIAGESSSSFFDKNRSNTKEAMIARATTILGTVFVVVTLVMLFITK